jgi:predicted nucleic acid-binding protein
MTQIHTCIRVGQDRRISGITPPEVPPGEHEVTVTLASPTRRSPAERFRVEDLPSHDVGWDDSISLSRCAVRMCTAAMTGDPVFVDTNVLVYATRRRSAHYAAAQTAVARLSVVEGRLAVVGLPPGAPRVSRCRHAAAGDHSCAEDGDRHRRRPTLPGAFQVAEEQPSVLDRLMHILAAHRTTGCQVHGANIVATMLECGVHRILTFNLSDFWRFMPLIEIAPLP